MAQRSSSPSSSNKNGFIQAVIMALVVTIILGYFLILIVSPTNMYYLTWTPKIKARAATSTYFGAQGMSLLLDTFPFLFIAVLGCIYLHLSKKSSDKNINRVEGKEKLAIWRRPIIMKGLGIVTRIELCFFVMFIALLVWSYASYLHAAFPFITPQSVAQSGQKVWEVKLEEAGLMLGLVGNVVLTFLFVPVTRGSSVLQLFGLTSEASVKYHIWLGHIVMTLFSAHGICYIIYWAVTHQLSEMLKWAKNDISNLAGELSLLSGLVLWIATFPRMRRKMFELFFYTHHLYILFVVFFVFHVGVSYAGIMLPGFYLFMVDRYLRFLQSRSNVRLVSARVLPCETVELNFSKSKGLRYTPTSIMFVNVPSISNMQWHPFTITSSSSLEADKLSVVIKGEGSWSKKLYQIISSPNSVDRLNVSVEGPYGPPSTHFLRHDLLVMVSGGSGITPFISIIRELIHTSESQKCKTPEILLICVFKNSQDLTMLDLLLPSSGAPSETSKLGLQIEAYVTREKQLIITEDKKNLRSIWFKPNPSDHPITPILGQNNWLWLGAIISSSFIIFLISLGALDKYYIYPIDKNTNEIYSYPVKDVLNMLLICISIVITSSAAFLWNKKHTGVEANQIQNMEGATPMASPNSWFYNADREMESLPQQSLLQSTNLHYGERPDLKRILFERKESSVGVLACGPKKMRHEVANICSSGLASNLHFESISFSW
ncbi:ferric reduction oxidase 2-like [Nicotiana tabacum]|uniref:ferric-chelate reductase (NADH) n=1 Tax=Nicotiana tabacum TaxID=4097 RepID=A0A1S4AW29_TOBAC